MTVLTSIPSPPYAWSQFHLGPLTIHIYAICILTGIVGPRFHHVFTHIGDYFFPDANLWNVFAIWDGGNALYGSLLGGAVGA